MPTVNIPHPRGRHPCTQSPGRCAVLAAACLAAFTINLDTTIVNVALPDLSSQLHASTRDLQWIVDGYNLAFAGLVLTAGSLGDRFGRRPALLAGLAGFALAAGGAPSIRRVRWSCCASRWAAARL